MFSEDDSDSEYGRIGMAQRASWPYERLLQREESEARRKASDMMREMHRLDNINNTPDEKEIYVPDKQILREYYPKINFASHHCYDWRRWRFFRFCLELQGFHKGQLDFTARTPERYKLLINVWSRFVPDFQDCISTSRSGRVHVGQSAPASSAEMPQDNGRKLWRAFYSRWGISRTVSVEEIKDYVASTCDVIRNFRDPVFQRLYLVDLPPEILGLIFSHTFSTWEDGRLLSTTCHYLRDIGHAYIFERRTLLMEFPRDFPVFAGEVSDQQEVQRQVADSLSRSLTTFLTDFDFLLSRQYICARISYLHVGTYWPLSTMDLAQDACAAQLSAMKQRITSLLARSAVLKNLHIFNVHFDLALAQKFTELPVLSMCGLYSCMPDATLEEHILSLPPATFHSRLRGLRISASQADPTCSFWLFLALHPILQLLHVSASASSAGYRAPESNLWSHLAPTLRNVQRLTLEGIDLTVDLHDWFLVTTMLGPIQLTHFKLQAERHMPCHAVVDLLNALHSCNAPLEVLVLDGIMPISKELFDTLSQLFPALRGLSVHRYTGRGTERCHERERVPWEFPLYEYAAYFRRFTRLRHFGANFYWDEDALSPRAIEILLNRTAYGEDEDHILMTSFHDIVLPFAAYCPSLTSFRVDCASNYFRISRSPSGAVIMEPPERSWTKRPANNGEAAEDRDKAEIWEPCSTFRTWGLPERGAG